MPEESGPWNGRGQMEPAGPALGLGGSVGGLAATPGLGELWRSSVFSLAIGLCGPQSFLPSSSQS